VIKKCKCGNFFEAKTKTKTCSQSCKLARVRELRRNYTSRPSVLEKGRLRARERRLADPDKYREQARQRRLAHPGKFRAYYERNKNKKLEHTRAAARKYYRENRDAIRARMRIKRRERPEYFRALNALARNKYGDRYKQAARLKFLSDPEPIRERDRKRHRKQMIIVSALIAAGYSDDPRLTNRSGAERAKAMRVIARATMNLTRKAEQLGFVQPGERQ
jgi:hypothetical protein